MTCANQSAAGFQRLDTWFNQPEGACELCRKLFS